MKRADNISIEANQKGAKVKAEGKSSPNVILALSVLGGVIILIVFVWRMDWSKINEFSFTTIIFILMIFLLVIGLVYLLLNHTKNLK